MNGFIISITGEETDAMYWSGTDVVASPNEATFYSDRAAAKYDVKDLVTRFIDSDVGVVRATKVVTVAAW